MSYQPPPPPLPPPPPNGPGMPSRPPDPRGPGRPGVGIGVGWGIASVIGGFILSLFLSQVIQTLNPNALSSGLGVTITVGPQVIVVIVAVALMFTPRLRMVGTGMLIAVGGAWVVFLGPLIGVGFVLNAICSGGQ